MTPYVEVWRYLSWRAKSDGKPPLSWVMPRFPFALHVMERKKASEFLDRLWRCKDDKGAK